jgi:hypothetical protein
MTNREFRVFEIEVNDCACRNVFTPYAKHVASGRDGHGRFEREERLADTARTDDETDRATQQTWKHKIERGRIGPEVGAHADRA